MSQKFQLNEDQQKAVKYHGEKPLLIDAGPGSGKTRVLIEKIKYLVGEKRIDPETLLIITFSNKAANELIERLVDSDLSNEDVNKMHISTIHSFCFTLLKDFGFSLDVLDENERNVMHVYKNLNKLGFVDEKFFKKRHVPALLKKFSEFTSFKVDIDRFEKYVQENFTVSQEYIDFINETQEEMGENYSFPEMEVKDNEDFKSSWYNARYNNIVNAYRIYLELLERDGYIDYSLLQSRALNFLNNNQNIVNSLRYKNILIDEFQDTDPIQMNIFEILMKNADSFTVVGDGEQSIYAFRGADVKFFNEFEKKYGAEVIPLQTNYRSTRSIVNFTENFIINDRPKDSKKQLHADENNNGPDESVFYITSQDKEFEATKIAKIIKHLKKSRKITNYSDVGILTRSVKGRINDLTMALKNEGIMFDDIGNEDLLEQNEIKSIILLIFFLIENGEKPHIRTKWEKEWLNLSGFASATFESFKTFKLSEKTREILLKIDEEYKNEVLATEKMVYKEKTGKTSRIKKFDGVFNRDEETLIEIFKRVNKPSISNLSAKTLLDFGVDDKHDLKFFNDLIKLKNKIITEKNKDMKYMDRTTLLEIYYDLLELINYLNHDFVEDEHNHEEIFNLAILSNILYNTEEIITRNNIETMFWYLYHNIENYDSKKIDSGDEVQIMTVHKSKGLEFPVVFVHGIQKDTFPAKFKDDEYALTGLFGEPRFPTPYKFYGYEKEMDDDKKQKDHYLDERRILYVAMTRAEDILILSQRENRKGELPDIKGIDFDSCPLIVDDYSTLPQIQSTLKEDDYGELLELSFTSVKNYNLCPFKYQLKNHFNFKESDNIYIRKGNISHRLLDRVHKASIKGDGSERIIENLPKSIKEKNTKVIENIKKYQNNFLKDVKVLDSELKFQFEVKEDNDKKYVITGQIDLIYQRNGKIGIMDFKATSRFKLEEHKKQLYIYLMAVKDNLKYKDTKIEELAVYLLNSQKIKYYDVDEDFIKNYSIEIDEIANKIQDNNFEMNRSTQCNSCTFNFICENDKDLDFDISDVVEIIDTPSVDVDSGNTFDTHNGEDVDIDDRMEQLVNERRKLEEIKRENIRIKRLKNELTDIDTHKRDDPKLGFELPDYTGFEDIGDKYDISVFKEFVPQSLNISLSEAIGEILSNEHPIHIDRLSKLLLNHLNETKVTKTIKNQILNEIAENDLGVVNGTFIYMDQSNIKFDTQSNVKSNTNLLVMPRIPNNRPIEYISTKELMEGMFIVVDRFYGYNQKTLYGETGRLFGFEHISNKTSGYLDDAFTELKSTNRIIISEDGKIKTLSLKNYQERIDELKNLYEAREKTTYELVEKRFPSPQITYDRFIESIDNSNEEFYAQIESALNIIDAAPGHTPKVKNKLKTSLNTLKSLLDKIDELAIDLAISSSNSGENPNPNKVETLLDDLTKLTESVKDYK
ncbi:MAG: UvrD-helicase domain-containing protein [Methanobrevibacter sp.]|nr:UvrD-helicase domain-containing protein [Candidatus Methanovirga aequatorialis]